MSDDLLSDHIEYLIQHASDALDARGAPSSSEHAGLKSAQDKSRQLALDAALLALGHAILDAKHRGYTIHVSATAPGFKAWGVGDTPPEIVPRRPKHVEEVLAEEPKERVIDVRDAVHTRELMTIDEAQRAQRGDELLAKIIDELGEVRRYELSVELKSEMSSLLMRVDEDQLEELAKIDINAQRLVVLFLVARARSAQQIADEIDVAYMERETLTQDVRRLFYHITEHVQSQHLGFIHGMALKHEPRHGKSWFDDATFFDEQIRDRLA